MCQKCEMFTQNSAPSITVTYSKKKWNNLTRSEVDSFCRNSFDVTCRKLSNNNCFNNHADNDETFFVQQLHKEKHVGKNFFYDNLFFIFKLTAFVLIRWRFKTFMGRRKLQIIPNLTKLLSSNLLPKHYRLCK